MTSSTKFENPELAGQFGVMSIPTLVVMKNGKIVNQSMGAKPKSAILAMLYRYQFSVSQPQIRCII